MKKRLIVSALIIIIVAIAIILFKAHRTVEDTPVPASGGSLITMTPLGQIPYYLQKDPRWGAETIGENHEKMATVGCTVTCLAMGLSALGYHVDPKQVCTRLKQHGGFTANGFVIWSKVGELTQGAVQVAVSRLSYRIIDAELLAKRPVIAKILLPGPVPIHHWVLIVGKDGTEYLAMDPLNQQRKLVKLSSRSKGIHAIRVFRITRPLP